MLTIRSYPILVVSLASTVLVGCGEGHSGGGTNTNGAELSRTLAYVLTDCQENHPLGQTLWAIAGGGAPHPIASLSKDLPVPAMVCERLGGYRAGIGSVVVGVFQRVGVSPNGHDIVFEVTDDFSALEQWQGVLSADEEGIFSVHADGSGLRRLGHASGAPWFRYSDDVDLAVSNFPGFAFSPNGALVAYTDIGPGASGAAAEQIFIMRLADGSTKQITCLPPIEKHTPFLLDVVGPVFVDDETVGFGFAASPTEFSINFATVDGDCSVMTRPPPVAIPGASVVPSFAITGESKLTYPLLFSDCTVNPLHCAVNPAPGISAVQEIFVEDRMSPSAMTMVEPNLVQLTNFQRVDTSSPFLAADDEHVVFIASIDHGSNPHHTCQLFSVSTLGGEPTQLTRFDTPEDAPAACLDFGPPGCGTFPFGQDLTTDVVLFASSCVPFGGNYNGSQLFAIRSDGSGLRRLTSAAGSVMAPDSPVSVQLPGPSAYSPAFPGR